MTIIPEEVTFEPNNEGLDFSLLRYVSPSRSVHLSRFATSLPDEFHMPDASDAAGASPDVNSYAKPWNLAFHLTRVCSGGGRRIDFKKLLSMTDSWLTVSLNSVSCRMPPLPP